MQPDMEKKKEREREREEELGQDSKLTWKVCQGNKTQIKQFFLYWSNS